MAVTPTPTETGKAMSLPMGMMSPLWFAFSAAASFGANPATVVSNSSTNVLTVRTPAATATGLVDVTV